jgi:hypothetical protein
MPMNPRLLRPTSSTLDRDAAVYLNAVAVADGQQLEPAVRKAINDFVVGCKRDGIWDAIKASCILMGARTLSGALTPLVGSAPTNNGPFVSGDYDRKTGLVGNGSSKHLDSNRANNADPQNSQHVSCYISGAGGTLQAIMGIGGSNINGSTLIFQNSLVAQGISFQVTSTTGQERTDSTTGFMGGSRISSANFTARQGGVSADASPARVSSLPSSGNLFVFARNVSGSFLRSTCRMAFYSIGEGLDLALLDTRVTSLYTAIGAAI